jgi:NhaA family Na+:H+ antiporter
VTEARREPAIERVAAPLREFTNSHVSGGIVLMAAAVLALVWANSAFADSYAQVWESRLTIGLADLSISKSLHDWINDGLMAIFFLLVGLEIKREILVGELASVQRAVLPVAAAVGGAIVPAAIFLAIVGTAGESARGWGIPMATDIAFALGVLALVGRRIPRGLRIFVTALAIADDLIAVTVIAIFYTSELSIIGVVAVAALVAVLAFANGIGIQRPLVYALLGIGLWLAVLESGVHGTIAGVLLAMTIPARQRIGTSELHERGRELLAEADSTAPARIQQRHAALWELETITNAAQAPMMRIEHALSSWVAFLIVPLFALSNAGVAINLGSVSLLDEPVVLGIVFGLVIGKQIGITAAAWLVVRSGLATLPSGVTWGHIYGAAWICGIGFTMSLFIAGLAYQPSGSLDLAKLGILVASVVAGLGGYLLLRRQAGDGSEQDQD